MKILRGGCILRFRGCEVLVKVKGTAGGEESDVMLRTCSGGTQSKSIFVFMLSRLVRRVSEVQTV
jgi:hypothetical protein